MKRIWLTCIVALGTVVASHGSSEEISVSHAPPVVVGSVPEAGATDVDPGLSEIRVRFSKVMLDNSWSWVQMSGQTFPRKTASARYDSDKRTCILPVQLEPGKTYALWINSTKLDGFKDAGGRPAVPYLIVFETRK